MMNITGSRAVVLKEEKGKATDNIGLLEFDTFPYLMERRTSKLV